MRETVERVNSPEDVKALPPEALPELADLLRKKIVEVTSRHGGHLASNLGTVELTIALLRTFSPPDDRLLFDVGHQAYAYKLLTGRADRFETLRQLDGISGFVNRSESPYDAFGAGHAGTAISAALGFAAARDLRGGNEHVVAVVGDASISNGVSFEALNNVAATTRRLIVVLNDNEMSISQNVGSISRHLGRLLTSPRYNKFKTTVDRVGIKRLRLSWFRRHYYRIEAALKSLFVRNAVFEDFGLRYIGPIDGHDFSLLHNALLIARNSDRPVLVHVATRKGSGYEPAASNPSAWHGTPAFDIATGKRSSGSTQASWSSVAGEMFLRLARQDKRIVAITAGMADGTGLGNFRDELPRQFFDVGISEAHQGVFAAGLAAAGLRPLVAVYSTFLQRSIDALIHDIAAQNLPVVICLDRSGVVSSDGQTHHGIFDLALLRSVPNVVVMQPRDGHELAEMLATAFTLEQPVVIRYPRGGAGERTLPDELTPLPVGRAEVLRPLPYVEDGKAAPTPLVALWSLGDMLPLAAAVGEILTAQGVALTLVNARFVKPLDKELLEQQSRAGAVLYVSFENAMAQGGFGSALQEALTDSGIDYPVMRVGWPDRFIHHAATNQELFERHKLVPAEIADQILASLSARQDKQKTS